jgi:hypothetical protein
LCLEHHIKIIEIPHTVAPVELLSYLVDALSKASGRKIQVPSELNLDTLGYDRGTLEGLREIASSMGGEFISSTFLGMHAKHRWRCVEGHVWEAAPSIIKLGHWCPKCWHKRMNDTRRISILDCQSLAGAKGGECLSTKFEVDTAKLVWRCAKGHVWEAEASSVKSGTWCRKCGNQKNADATRGSIDDCREIARKMGGECLSSDYLNNHTKLRWCCANGHEWEAAPFHILHSGTWCPACRRHQITLEDLQTAARSKGGECLSSVCLGANVKHRWRCAEGHEWEARASSVKNQGTWCRKCVSKKGRSQASALSPASAICVEHTVSGR